MLIFGALVLKLAPGNFENLVCGTPAKPRSLSLCHLKHVMCQLVVVVIMWGMVGCMGVVSTFP